MVFGKIKNVADKFKKDILKIKKNELKAEINTASSPAFPNYKSVPGPNRNGNELNGSNFPIGSIIKWIIYFCIIGIVIFGISILFGFAQGIYTNPLVLAITQSIGLDDNVRDVVDNVENTKDLAKCYISNVNKLTQVGDIRTGQIVANPFNNVKVICDEQLGRTAKQIGCTECFDLSIKSIPRIYSGTDQTIPISSTLFLSPNALNNGVAEYCYSDLFGKENCQKLTQPTNMKIEFYDRVKSEKITDIKGTCFGVGVEECNPLDPNILPINLITYLSSQNVCGQNTIDIRGELSYRYITEGSNLINIRKEGVLTQGVSKREPVTLPGPVKIDIISDSDTGKGFYDQEIDIIGFVSVKLRNNGVGEAQVNRIKLKQLVPENGAERIQFTDCAGPIIDWNEDSNGDIIINLASNAKLDAKQKTSQIICTMDLSNINVGGEFATYIITGEAEYNYKLTRKATSIIVDDSIGNCNLDSTVESSTSNLDNVNSDSNSIDDLIN